MKVTAIHERKVFIVETDEVDYYSYLRCGPEHWIVRMGESVEEVYDCKDLERAFQKMCPSEIDTSGDAVGVVGDEIMIHKRKDPTA